MTHPSDLVGRPPKMKPMVPKIPEARPALRCEDKDGRAVVYVPYAATSASGICATFAF